MTICLTDDRGNDGPSVVAAWNVAGGTLGVALDLGAGTLHLSVNGGDWALAFPNATHTSPCRPSVATGAALFPALCGSDGVRVRCNWGVDALRPMKFTPPSGEYMALGLARKVTQRRL
jgi:hypothetical protein